MIVPGDRKLTAPKTNTGATEKSHQCREKDDGALGQTPSRRKRQCEQAEAQKQGGQRPRAYPPPVEFLPAESCVERPQQNSQKDGDEQLCDTSTRTVSMVTVIAKTGVSLIRGPVERQRATYA